jgi:hypothetical protein
MCGNGQKRQEQMNVSERGKGNEYVEKKDLKKLPVIATQKEKQTYSLSSLAICTRCQNSLS